MSVVPTRFYRDANEARIYLEDGEKWRMEPDRIAEVSWDYTVLPALRHNFGLGLSERIELVLGFIKTL